MFFSDDQKEVLTAVFSAASDWLWDVEDPTTVMYEDKLAELKKETRDWVKRVEENEKRPEAVERLEVSYNTVIEKKYPENVI